MKTAATIIGICFFALHGSAAKGEGTSLPISSSVQMSVKRAYSVDPADPAVLISAVVGNVSDKTVAFARPWPRVNFRVSVLQEGHVLSPRVPDPIIVSGGVGVWEVKSKESFEYVIDLSRWFDLSHAKTSTVKIVYTLEYLGDVVDGKAVHPPNEQCIAEITIPTTQ